MKATAFCSFIASIVTCLLISGCGSVSQLETSENQNLQSIGDYDSVMVLDFSDKTHPSIKDSSKLEIHRDRVEMAGENFADRIVSELQASGQFKAVVRENLEGRHLIISGDIVRYAEGNAAARLWIGMGAGSSFFDANVVFKDGESGKVLGKVAIDKNSWVLGGGIASGQTVEHFMNRGAKRIAEELQEIKNDNVSPASLGSGSR